MILGFYQSKSHSFQNPKKRVFPFFSQLPETLVLKFCPELETLLSNESMHFSAFCVMIFRSTVGVGKIFF